MVVPDGEGRTWIDDMKKSPKEDEYDSSSLPLLLFSKMKTAMMRTMKRTKIISSILLKTD